MPVVGIAHADGVSTGKEKKNCHSNINSHSPP